MKYLVKQHTFEGPLDLLLQLIEHQELDITTISLATVTDDYLTHLKTLERQQLPEISDWLVVAARLLLLKSRALLPDRATDGVEPDDLAQQLTEYKLYKAAAAELDERMGSLHRSFGKSPSTVSPPAQVVVDGVDLTGLHQAFAEILERLPEPRALGEETLEQRLTIEECIDEVKIRLAKGPKAFEAVFTKLRSRVAIIVTFLAILELVKQRLLTVNYSRRQLTLSLRSP